MPPGARRAGLGYLLYAGALAWLACSLEPERLSSLRFGPLGTVQLPTRMSLLGWSALALGSGLWGLRGALSPRRRALLLGLHALGLVCSILLWASMQQRLEVLGLLAQSCRLATPILLGALAGLLSERSGIVNIGLEGMMLAAACLGFTAALYTASPWLGVGVAALVGGAMAAGHAVLAIHGQVNHIISSTVLNIFAVGFTGFVRRTVLLHSTQSAPAVLPTWPVPLLSDLPVLGQIFFRHQPLVYVTWCLVILIEIILRYTPWGLRTRAIGEQPRAAETMGVPVVTMQYMNVIAGGMLAGLGGAWFSLETVGTFDDMMTGGKGFIALAAMIFGQWTPWGALQGALVFGFVDALQIKLQIAGLKIPYQVLSMSPYVVTMVLLVGFIGKAVPPGAAGQPSTRSL
ncbi:MAG: ABC transporter permease [Candidatus Tectimicrobiota bacterium]